MKRILLVEDDAALRGNLTDYLEELGYLVLEASSGREGLEIFDHQSPDLIISDVGMPEMDGLEFCRRLRSRRKGQLVPFIFLSGQNELEDRLQGHKMGADDYINKPFSTQEIVAKIENLLERSLRLQQEILRVLDRVKAPEAPAHPSPGKDLEKLPLTPAEAKVFAEVIEGRTNKEIGERLFVSDRTVQAHLTKIFKKLNFKNRNELIRFALENGYQASN